MARKATGGRGAGRRVRPIWSGAISFGLVAIPVNLFPATRGARTSFRLLDEDGTPLSRRYYCEKHNVDVHPEHIVRGYAVGDDEYVVVRDEELEAISPRKTREINLRRFVPVEQIPPLFFERAYFLTPAGVSVKAYRLLADVLQRSGRAGIATFVMRTKEHLVAILAEQGILRAETLRFPDEVRSPADIGLPEKPRLDQKRVSRWERAMRKRMEPDISLKELESPKPRELHRLVEHKVEHGEYVVAPNVEDERADEEEGEVDLLETIRASLADPGRSTNGRPRRDRRQQAQDDLAEQSKTALYERAKELNIPGRSKMSKPQLERALRRQRA